MGMNDIMIGWAMDAANSHCTRPCTSSWLGHVCEYMCIDVVNLTENVLAHSRHYAWAKLRDGCASSNPNPRLQSGLKQLRLLAFGLMP